MESLQEKRAALADRAKAQQEFDPHWMAEAAKGNKLTDRPVAFQCDDEVVAIGDDVGKLFGGFAKFNELAKSEPWQRRRKAEPTANQAITKVEKLLADPRGPELRVPQQIWNALMFAAGEVGMLVVLSDGIE